LGAGFERGSTFHFERGMAERHIIQLKTERFRTSLDPLWVRLRHLLIERDLDPLTMVLACFEPEDFRFRFGIFVTGDRRIYQFGFDFAGKLSRDGHFSEWNDITDTWRETGFRNPVTEALAVAEAEEGRLRS